jgi:hypothetical protein
LLTPEQFKDYGLLGCAFVRPRGGGTYRLQLQGIVLKMEVPATTGVTLLKRVVFGHSHGTSYLTDERDNVSQWYLPQQAETRNELC